MKLLLGNNLELLKQLPDSSVDAIVTDPPYGLGKEPDALAMLKDWTEAGHHDVKSKRGFMGKEWDAFVPQPAQWKECLRVLKPGGQALVFAGTRTQDLMALGMRIAGFEIRDLIAWVYGSGFPKVKTVLKPALEPITLARKPGKSWMNIDGCRVEYAENDDIFAKHPYGHGGTKPITDWCRSGSTNPRGNAVSLKGRWPANLIHDGSDEVLAAFPDAKGQQGDLKNHNKTTPASRCFGSLGPKKDHAARGDSGSAARFFYCAKASAKDRNEGCEDLPDKEWANDGACIPERENRPFNPSKNNHPTVKPTELMRYLCRLITPPGGTILDPWMGSGSTGKAAKLEELDFIGIEMDPSYFKIAQARCGVSEEEDWW